MGEMMYKVELFSGQGMTACYAWCVAYACLNIYYRNQKDNEHVRHEEVKRGNNSILKAAVYVTIPICFIWVHDLLERRQCTHILIIDFYTSCLGLESQLHNIEYSFSNPPLSSQTANSAHRSRLTESLKATPCKDLHMLTLSRTCQIIGGMLWSSEIRWCQVIKEIHAQIDTKSVIQNSIIKSQAV